MTSNESGSVYSKLTNAIEHFNSSIVIVESSIAIERSNGYSLLLSPFFPTDGEPCWLGTLADALVPGPEVKNLRFTVYTDDNLVHAKGQTDRNGQFMFRRYQGALKISFEVSPSNIVRQELWKRLQLPIVIPAMAGDGRTDAARQPNERWVREGRLNYLVGKLNQAKFEADFPFGVILVSHINPESNAETLCLAIILSDCDDLSDADCPRRAVLPLSQIDRNILNWSERLGEFSFVKLTESSLDDLRKELGTSLIERLKNEVTRLCSAIEVVTNSDHQEKLKRLEEKLSRLE